MIKLVSYRVNYLFNYLVNISSIPIKCIRRHIMSLNEVSKIIKSIGKQICPINNLLVNEISLGKIV